MLLRLSRNDVGGRGGLTNQWKRGSTLISSIFDRYIVVSSCSDDDYRWLMPLFCYCPVSVFQLYVCSVLYFTTSRHVPNVRFMCTMSIQLSLAHHFTPEFPWQRTRCTRLFFFFLSEVTDAFSRWHSGRMLSILFNTSVEWFSHCVAAESLASVRNSSHCLFF